MTKTEIPVNVKSLLEKIKQAVSTQVQNDLFSPSNFDSVRLMRNQTIDMLVDNGFRITKINYASIEFLPPLRKDK